MVENLSSSELLAEPPIPALELQQGERTSRGWIAAWALWDWGGAAFNAVITTFVFTVYLTDPIFASDGDTAKLSADLGFGLAIAGFVIAVLAPIVGQHSDRRGRRKLWLGIHTGVVVLSTALLFFVEAKPGFFVLGVVLISIGSVFYDLAVVNYNALLLRLATPRSVGRISGLGVGAGYLGGIVLLLVVYVGLVAGGTSPGTGGILGVPEANGFNIRVIALICAAWTLVFALPVLLVVPEPALLSKGPRRGPLSAYADVARQIAALWRESRSTVWFLIASAIFRDGLTAIFVFAGILAAGTFGFTAGEVIVFAIAANVIAGVSTVLAGGLDDRFGPKPVIVVSLVAIIVAGFGIFLAHDGGPMVFWVGGLFICLFVGPAASASRSFLARVTPAGQEGQTFGLYATTGRAVSFLSPLLFALFVSIFGAQYFGLIGICILLVAGLVLLIPVKMGRRASA